METPSIPSLLDEVLVIGYGNTLRQDDGVGPYVAERFEELGLPGVRTLVEAQLSPEHAEVISMAKAVASSSMRRRRRRGTRSCARSPPPNPPR